MKVALPVDGGKVSGHFGHAEKFAIFEVDCSSNAVAGSTEETPPPHEEGAIPNWLKGLGVNLIIAGGIGMKAKQLFGEMGIDVISGAPVEAPAAILKAHLEGTLVSGENVCGHEAGEASSHGCGDGSGGGCGGGTPGGCGGH